MEDKVIQIYACIKEIDNELQGLLKEREMYRQMLIEMLPCIENTVPEIELKPKEEVIENNEMKVK